MKNCQIYTVFYPNVWEKTHIFKAFKKIYCCNTNVAVKIVKGKGGNAQNIVIDADKIPGGFSIKIVLLDNDKSKTEMTIARKEAKSRNIELIENTPCLEFLL